MSHVTSVQDTYEPLSAFDYISVETKVNFYESFNLPIIRNIYLASLRDEQ